MASLIRLYDEQGQSPWLDNLTRPSLRDGTMADLIARGVRGVTANPTIVAKAIESSDAYDQQLHDLLAAGHTLEDAYWELAITDVVDALELLRPTFDASEGADGFVSIEVAPDLANDTGRHHQGRPGPARTHRRAQPAGQDPGHHRRRARHRGHGRGRPQHQRHPDLLPGPLPPGPRGLPVGPGGPGPPRRETSPPSTAWRRSSSAGSTPRSTDVWRRSAPTRRSRCAAEPPSRKPSSPTSSSARPTRAAVGTAGRPRRPGADGRCGHPRRPRTPTTPTPSTSTA